MPEFRKEDGVPGENRGNTLDFDHEGWTAEVMHDGSMRITGRSPRGTRRVLFHVVKISGAGVPGKPATVENSNGDQYLLVTGAPN
jgi:hypothetical protein